MTLRGWIWGALALATAGLVLVPHFSSAGHKLPERVFAPYVDMGLLANDLAQIHRESGARYFTLAFVNAGERCTPTWADGETVAAEKQILQHVQELREHGGEVIIAFGGYEGAELAQSCTDVATLQAAYQQVVSRYRPAALDFDIEHLSIDDAASIELRSRALKLLAQANPGVAINFTLPATPAGLTDKSMKVLASAVAQGVPVRVVNLMTMNYGATAPSKEMGENAISAARAAIAQLQAVGVKAKLGITPMLGVNDVAGETFTLPDASAVVAYAQSEPEVALLAYWSTGRDNGSCMAQVSPQCSGIAQRKWEFARIFSAFH